ncbi:non-homologous end-joining DNA ligase [Micromonospora sp. NPDC003776]
MSAERLKVDVEGRALELSNLDKVLYPKAGFTKGEVIDYYTRIAPVLLPHLRDRALTRIRFPNGVEGGSFFEKNKPNNTPDWVRIENLPAPGSSKGRETIDYVVCEDLPTLVWLANLAALELHTPQWQIGEHPDMMVLDLDPGAPAALKQCCQVALLMRDRLAEDGIESYPKTSGKKGMQLCCPIAGTQDADDVSAYAKRIAQELEKAHPKLIVSKMARNLRPGKVFIDWSQNNAAKTTVAPYSLRAQAVPSVSTPLTWDEVSAGAAGKRPATKPYTADEVLKRVAKQGDLLAPLLDGGPELPG